MGSHRTTRFGRVLLSIGVASVALTACSSSSGSGSGSGAGSGAGSGSVAGASTPAALTTVRFATGWVTPDFEDIPVLVAQQKGYYAAAGLKVTVNYPPTTTTAPKLLATGTDDIGYLQTADLVQAVQQNVPLKAVAGVWQRPSNALVAKPGVKIDPSQFKGKTFAVFAGAENIASLNLFLKSANLTTSDVKVVTASSDNLALVLAGKVDYALNASPYAAGEIKAATGKDPSLLLASSLPVQSNYAQTAYGATSSWLSSHADIARKWLAATQKGAQWAIDNPAEAVAMFQKSLGKASGGNLVYNTAGWNGAIPLIKGDGPLFAMTDAQWSSLFTFLREGGALKGTAPKFSDLYTNQYLAGS